MTSATRLISTLCEFEPDCVVVVVVVVVVETKIIVFSIVRSDHLSRVK